MATSNRAARTTNELISQLPDPATASANMLKKLGLWSTRAHDAIDERRPFKQNLSQLESDQLADEQAYWSSEAGRITELHGLLTSLKVQTDLSVKIAMATARNQVRKDNKDKTDAAGKPIKLTAGEVNDLAETMQVLKDARDEAVLVESTMASVSATREATLLYLNTISREITRRGDLAKARL